MRPIVHICIGNAPIYFTEMLEMYSKFQFKTKLFHQVQEEEEENFKFGKFSDLLIICTRSDFFEFAEDLQEKKAKQRKKLMSSEIYRVGSCLLDVIIDVPNRNYQFVWAQEHH